MASRTRSKRKTSTKQQVQIHYIKSNLFRVVSGEGVIGSLSPHGKIFFAVYDERGAIPRTMVHLVSEEGQLGDVVETETRGGIVREMEVGVLMDLEDAIRFRDWMTTKITEFQKAQKEKSRNVRKSPKR